MSVNKATPKDSSVEVGFVEGINSLACWNIAKKSEFSHAENARCLRIGSVEKRDGFERYDSNPNDVITENHLLAYNPRVVSDAHWGLFRIAHHGSLNLTKLYYMKPSGATNVNAEISFPHYAGGTDGVFEASSSGTEITVTNPSGNTYRYAWNNVGPAPNFPFMCRIGNSITISGTGLAAANEDTFTITGVGDDYFEVTNAGGSAEANKAIGTGYIAVTRGDCDYTLAEGNLYVTTKETKPFRIGEDGTTLALGTESGSDLYGCPIASKINYYNGKLYVGDFQIGSKRFRNQVQMSSPLLGIVSLVDGDHTKKYSGDWDAAADTEFTITNPYGDIYRYSWTGVGTEPDFTEISVGASITIANGNFSAGNEGTFTITSVGSDYFEVENASGVVESATYGTSTEMVIAATPSINVSDTKYIESSDTLDVYRGNTLITTLTVTSKTETTIVTDGLNVDLLSADELWINGTKTGESDPQFRWVNNPNIGTNVKRYDTFSVPTGENDAITMMQNVGDYMAISTKRSFAFWNGYALQNVDMGIGCVSDQGYVRNNGTLCFMGYDGIYMTTGADMPKLISSPVERYIKGATTAGLEGSVAGKKGFSVFFTLGDVTLYNEDGSTEKTLSDACVEWDIRKDLWFVHDNFEFSHMVSFETSTDPDILLGLSTNSTDYTSPLRLMEILQNETLVDDNNGGVYGGTDVEILFRADSPKFQLAPPGKKAYVTKIIAQVERGTGISCFVDLDDGGFYELKDRHGKGITKVDVHNKDGDMISPPECSTIRISFREYGARKVKISGYEIHYILTDGIYKPPVNN